MKLKYILMCALAMIGIATQAQNDVNYDISTTPATEVVEGHMYVLQNRKYTEIGLAYDGSGATTFDPVSEQLGQFVTSVQNFFFTATADGFTLPVTLDNINDANIDWGYGETGGGTVLSPKRKAADNTVYFTVKDAAGQYVMLYNSALYGVNATTPAESAQWIAYEVKEHEHKWAPNEDRTHYCTVCSVEEEEHSYIDGVCEICQHECRHSSYIDGVCEYCGAECEHNNGWVHNEEDDYCHYCIDCYHQERHHIAEDGGACVCGFECPGHEFFFDSEVSISASNETTGEYVMHFECVFCQYQKTETVDPDAECPNGGQHEWEDNVCEATCTMRGYTSHYCSYCILEYISDFTDIDPDNHNWCLGYVENEEGNLIHTNTHYCTNGCEAYGSEQEHTMVDGRCTVCGYWPGHTEHKWQTDDMYHHCSILGCQEYGEDWSDHEFDEHCTCTICGFTCHVWGENGICENCGTGCQHEWDHGYCYICNTECNHDDHNSIVPAAAIPATCTKEGWKKHYECSICQMMFANAEGEDIWDYSDDFVIEKLGHDIGDDLCCRREGCEVKVTISSTEITLGEAANVDFMNYTINYNDDDPTAEPLYKIVVAEHALYSFSIPESIARQLDSPGVDVFDKNFKWVVDTSLDPDYLSSIFFEEAGTYYLQPSAYSERDVEFVRKDVPLTVAIVESITLNPEEVTDDNGDPVVITRTEDGSYATTQNVVVEDGSEFYSEVEFSVPEVSYSRDLSAFAGSDWGTLCLPFDYTVDDAAAAGLSVYEFTDASADAVIVTRRTTGTITCGTPVLIKKTGEGEGTSLTLSATNTKMGFMEKQTADINGLVMEGALYELGVNSGYYLDAQDGMLHSIEEWCSENDEDYLTIPAYRAFFRSVSEGFGGEAHKLKVEIDGEEMSAIDAVRSLIQGNATIYGLDGKVRNDLQMGVNIVNGRKIIVK